MEPVEEDFHHRMAGLSQLMEYIQTHLPSSLPPLDSICLDDLFVAPSCFGWVIQDVTRYSWLRRLVLVHVGLEDEHCKYLGQLARLEMLDVSWNTFLTDQGIKDLLRPLIYRTTHLPEGLTSLRYFYAAGCLLLTFQSLELLFKWTILEEVDLSYNYWILSALSRPSPSVHAACRSLGGPLRLLPRRTLAPGTPICLADFIPLLHKMYLLAHQFVPVETMQHSLRVALTTRLPSGPIAPLILSREPPNPPPF
jgi:hypothetical protein